MDHLRGASDGVGGRHLARTSYPFTFASDNVRQASAPFPM